MKDVKVGDRIKVTTDMPKGQPIRLGDELTVKDVNDDGRFCAILAYDKSNVLFFLIEAWFDVVRRADGQADQKLKKFGMVLHGDKGWSCGQQFAANKESAVSAAMSEGYTVWRAFDMETEVREWWCAIELLAEISGVMNIDPNKPIRLGVIKEETK